MLDREQITLHIPAATIAKVIFVILLFVLAFFLRDILLVILAAVVIASSIEPSIRWFRARRVPRILAVLTIYLGLGLIFLAAFYLLFIPLVNELQIFLSELPKYLGSISSVSPTAPATSATLSALGTPEAGAVGNLLNSLPLSTIFGQVNTALSALSASFFGTASALLGGVFSFVLIVILSFYLAVQQDGILNFLKTISPSRHRKYVVDLWNRSENKIGLWLQGQLLLCVFVAMLTYLGLTLLGVKHALLLAFIAGVFEIIPLFGSILAAIPAIAVAFANGGVPITFVVIALYLIIQQFESQLIYPLVVKKVVGVPPIISIVALIVGAKLAGFLGLILSVPVAAILMEFFHDLERDRIREEREREVAK